MLTPVGCRGRVARLCAALDSALDGAIISRPEHVFYFANVCPPASGLPGEGASFLLIRKNGSTTLFTDNWHAPESEAAADEIFVVEWYSMKEPARDRRYAVASAVAAHLRAAGLRAIGVETAALPLLIARAAGEMVDIDGLIGSLRETKDPDEIAAIRATVRAAEAVHGVSRKLLRPGLREIDYFASLEERALQAVERPFLLACNLVSGERSAAGSGPPSSRVMAEGELVILHLFPSLDGYRADLTNTLSVGGSPSAGQRDAFACAQASLRAGEMRLRPGAPVAEIFTAMDGELRAWDRSWTLVRHGGHSVGLFHPEAPQIVPRSDRTLRAGMVLTLEPGVFDRSFGGLRLEHTYLITGDGFERLSGHELGL